MVRPITSSPIVTPGTATGGVAGSHPTANPLGVLAPHANRIASMSGTPPLIPRMAGGQNPLSSTLSAASEALTRSLEARYGFYSNDHPFAQYMQELGKRISKDGPPVRILVTRSWDDINAMALPNGTIIVSDRLIKFCEFEEELLSVLDHEYQHVIRRHSEKRMELMEEHSRGGKIDIDGMLKFHAQSRLQEYESDLRGSVDLADRGINPYGGIIFLNRLAEMDDSKDLEHGGAIDRSLNIGLVTRLYDLKVLTTQLKLIPEAIQTIPVCEEKTDYQVLVSEGIRERGGRYVMNHDRLGRLEKASFHTLLEALPKVAQRFQKRSEETLGGELREQQLAEDKKVLKRMLLRLRSMIDEQMPKKSKNERLLALTAALCLDVDINLFEIADPENPLSSIADEVMDHLDTLKDFKTFLRLLSPELFEHLGLYVNVDPIEFLKNIAQTALEADLFSGDNGKFVAQDYFDFAIVWIRRMESLTRRRGTGKWDQSETFLEMVLLATPNLGDETELINYFDQSTQQDIPLKREMIQTEAFLRGIGTMSLKESLVSVLELINEANEDNFETIVQRLEEIVQNQDTSLMTQTLQLVIDHCEENRQATFLFQFFKKIFSTTRVSALASHSRVEKWIWAFKTNAALDINQLKKDLVAESLWEIEPDSTNFQDLTEIQKLSPYYSEHGNFQSLLSLSAFHKLTSIIANTNKKRFMEIFWAVSDKLISHPEFGEGTYINLFFNTLFSTYSFDLSDLHDVKFLYETSFFFTDAQLAFQLRECLATRILEGEDKKVIYDFLFRDERSYYGTSFDRKNRYIDKKINSPSDLEELKRLALEKLDQTPKSSQGKLVIADILEKALKGKKKILTTLMETSRDDSTLRKTLFHVYFEDRQGYGEDDEVAAYAMHSVDQRLSNLYMLDPLGIHALVRFLLVGNQGLLRSEKDRRWLLDYFFEKYVGEDSNTTELNGILRRGLNELVIKADLESLYFIFAPLIEKRILKPPLKSPEWEGVMKTDTRLKKEEYDNALNHYQKYRQGKAALLPNGPSAPSYELEVKKLINTKKEITEDAKTNPVKVVLEIASKLGSIGKRFLQILGQYVPTDPAYEEEFQEVYDALPGQTKLTAYLLLKREWPELAQEIAEINENIGGGSLMTTFRATATNGEQEVIKALNPNAEYFLERIYGILEQTLKALAEKHGAGYEIAPQALADIRKWIEQDIRFEGFLEKDQMFYGHNHGFQPEGFRYAIKVPKSKGPENKYFKREEFVAGTNLTQLAELRAQGHDVKAVVRLLVQNYWHQIQTGLVHSDVHPGNFRVTSNNEVAILDRNFFIELDQKDQDLLKGLVTTVDQPEALANLVIDYFAIASKETGDDLRTEIQGMNTQESPMERIKKIMISLNQKKIPIPLKITLLLKNVNGLDRLAKSAGFRSLQEALF